MEPAIPILLRRPSIYSLVNSTDEQLDALLNYTNANFPELTKNDFFVPHYAASKLPYLASVFSNYDLVICPGDSPSKYVKALELAEMDLGDAILVTFPLSGLGQPGGVSVHDQGLLRVYLEKVLAPYDDINPTRIAIFDYVSSGYTYVLLSNIIRSIYDTDAPIPLIETPIVGSKYGRELLSKYEGKIPFVTNILLRGPYDTLYDLDVLFSDARGDHNSIMIEGDRHGSRCVPSYKISQFDTSPIKIDTVKCKLITVFVVLAYYKVI